MKQIWRSPVGMSGVITSYGVSPVGMSGVITGYGDRLWDGWLVGWLAGWLAGRPAGWLVWRGNYP